MTSLLQQRRKLERSNNYKLLASIIDWTVALYVVVPALVIGFFLYKDFILNISTSWVIHIPLVFLIVLLFLITRIETIRTYLQRADRLFLIQNRKQMVRLKQAGLYWSLSKHLILLGSALALLAPIFIIVHHVTILELLILLLLLFTTNFTNILLQLKLRKWQQLVSKIFMCILGTVFFLYVPALLSALIYVILLVCCTSYYNRHFVYSTKHFDQQVEFDQAAFYKWQSLLFQIAPELRSQLVPKLKKPRLLWKNSKRMFRRSDYFIEELVCKTMLRQKQYLFGYLRFLSMGIGLTIIVPSWAKIIVLGILYFTLRSMMQSVIQQTFEHKIWSIFQVTNEQIQAASNRLLKGFVDLPLLCVLIILIIILVL
ncbi:ABC transporter permease [Lysinibacillus sp. NPDC093216]|uniref:ABC transporter permease n=1 Tax=Lysinibacillus sp. NPDC093216 TaxID=3390576 RepID=UPI003D04CBB9